MLNGTYITLDRVIENVYRDYGFNNINWIDCVEWIGECLDLIGAPKTYIEKATDGKEKLGHDPCIEIVDNRGTLPCDIHQLIQAFQLKGGNYLPMRVSTDTSHIAYNCTQSTDFNRDSETTYKLNNNHIFTSFKTGNVVLVYRANPTDENGYPMIPNNIKFIKACAAYVADKILMKRMVQGKAVPPAAAQRIEQDYLFYVGAADIAARMPTIDDMESWKNNLIRLIPDVNSHATGFRGNGRMERRFNNSTNDYKN